MNGKKLWYSKTFWFNVITLALETLALTEFKNLVPPTWTPYLLFINIFGNLILRKFFTVGPIN